MTKTVRVLRGSQTKLLDQFLPEIAAHRAEGRHVILYVPEQFTFQAERELIEQLQLPGLMDLDVISPTKLRQQVLENGGKGKTARLDAVGRGMAIQAVLANVKDTLHYYKSSVEMTGALRQIDQELYQMEEDGITLPLMRETAEGLPEGALREKWHDLICIREALEDFLGEDFQNEIRDWTEMCTRIPRSRVLQDCALYVYGFDTIRRDLHHLLCVAANCCCAVCVGLQFLPENAANGWLFAPQREALQRLGQDLSSMGVQLRLEELPQALSPAPSALQRMAASLFSLTALPEKEECGGHIRLFAAPNPYTEVCHAIETLNAWHAQGMAWQNMVVAYPPDSGRDSLLAALLRIYGIPHFIARQESLAGHGVSRLLLAGLECAANGFGTGAPLEAARSGFSALTDEEGLALQNYAFSWGIRGSKWQKAFTKGATEEQTARMEEIRQRLMTPLLAFVAQMRKAKTVDGAIEAMLAFLQAEEVWQKLCAHQEAMIAGQFYTPAMVDQQVWKKLMDTLELLHQLLKNQPVTPKLILAMVQEALEKSAVSTLPSEDQGVLSGQADHVLPGRVEGLLLLGANEGMLQIPEGGVLSARERIKIRAQTGKESGMAYGRMKATIYGRYYRLLTLPTEKLQISWSLRGEDGASQQADEMVTEIRHMFTDLREEGGIYAGSRELHPVSPLAAMEGLPEKLRQAMESGEALPREWQQALYLLSMDPKQEAAVRKLLQNMTGETLPVRISPDLALPLYSAEKISVSRLERYAACPYQFFVQYGLRPLPPEPYAFTARDAGDFYHAVLSGYMKKVLSHPKWPDLSDEELLQMAEEELLEQTAPWQEGPLAESAVNLWQGEQYKRNARHTARAMAAFAANSDFRPIGMEQSFGRNGLRPLVLKLRDGSKVALEGVIDRVDEYRAPSGNVYRLVVDYKSSERDLDLQKVADGRQLQLPLYLKVACDDREGCKPAGCFYCTVKDKEVDLPAEAAEKLWLKRLETQRWRGLTVAEEEVLEAIDRKIPHLAVANVLNKDGSISKSCKTAVDMQTAVQILEDAVKTAEIQCEEMRAGKIEPRPGGSKPDSPCIYCQYQSICCYKDTNKAQTDEESENEAEK